MVKATKSDAASVQAVVHTSAKSPAQTRREALVHFAAVLADPKAAAARKDKAARLILTHTGTPAGKSRRGKSEASADKGKKELQREAAAQTAAKPGKWTGLLQ